METPEDDAPALPNRPHPDDVARVVAQMMAEEIAMQQMLDAGLVGLPPAAA